MAVKDLIKLLEYYPALAWVFIHDGELKVTRVANPVDEDDFDSADVIDLTT